MTLSRRRTDLTERMDDVQSAPRAELAENLRELSWTNRWFGGDRSLQVHLRDLRGASAARVLDVGTGDGATLLRLQSWAEARGGAWTTVGLDREARFLDLREQGDTFLACAGDGLHLPFPNNAFDAVVSLQTLHHLSDSEIPGFLREMVRVSRGLVVVSDLRRNVAAYLGANLLSALVWKNPLTRHDGPVSVRRGFKRTELLAHGQTAGIPNLAVHSHGPFRWVLTGTSSP